MNADIVAQSQITEATKLNPCPHCGKPDWCYSLGELSVCNRDAEPSNGWKRTSKTDRNQKPYYTLNRYQKTVEPKQRRDFVYTSRDGFPLIKVSRSDDGNGKKSIFQSHWDGKNWQKGLTEEIKKQVPLYRYQELRQAISENRPIFVVEGEGLVDKLWELGLAATTTIGGAGKYRNAYGDYKQDLEGGELILCPDRDKPGLKHMDDIFQDFPDAKWLYSPPSDFYWKNLPKSGGLDIKDWIEQGATVGDILEAIEARRVIVDSLEESFCLDFREEREQRRRSKFLRKFKVIEESWGERLRWNVLKKIVELDGERLYMDRIRLRIAIDLDIDVTKEEAKQIVLQLAHRNSYNPIVEYLNRISNVEVDSAILDKIALKYFGTPDPLHAILIKKTLIAAVARAYQPGCKHDNITILQGEQGIFKSTFWEVLASREYFTDDITTGTEKDEILKISRYWFLEYSEFETAYRKKDVSQLKSFLSRRHDSIRVPYGSDVEDFLRPSIFVGTTNSTEFLYDATGQRRYWVIPCLKRIPIELLKQERDSIWAAAVEAYRSGESWHLNAKEDLALKKAGERYQASDSWEEPISQYLSGRSFTVVGDILSDVLKLELSKQDRASEMRVAEILKRSGWNKGKQRRIDGKPRWVWEPSKELMTLSNPVEESTLEIESLITPNNEVLEVVTAPNLAEESLLAIEALITPNNEILEVVTPSSAVEEGILEDQNNLSQPSNPNFPNLEGLEEFFTTPLFQESSESSCDSKIDETPQTPSGQGFGLKSPPVTSKQSKRSPKSDLIVGCGHKADYCGETVTIVGFEDRGSKVQIEFASGRFQTVKKGVLKPVANSD